MMSSFRSTFLSITMGIFLILSAHSAMANSVQWQSYSDDVFSSAKTQHKLVLIYVNSETCHWCAEMNREAFDSPTILSLISKKFIPVSVDIASERSIADSYGAYGTPTFVILDSNQHEVSRLVGYQSADSFQSYLEGL